MNSREEEKLKRREEAGRARERKIREDVFAIFEMIEPHLGDQE